MMLPRRFRIMSTIVAACLATAVLAALDGILSAVRILVPLLLCSAGGLALAWALFAIAEGVQAGVPAVVAAVALWMWALEIARKSGAKEMAEAVTVILKESRSAER